MKSLIQTHLSCYVNSDEKISVFQVDLRDLIFLKHIFYSIIYFKMFFMFGITTVYNDCNL